MNKQLSVLHYQKTDVVRPSIATSLFRSPDTLADLERAYIAKRRADIQVELKQNEKDLRSLKSEEDRLSRLNVTLHDFVEWGLASNLQIERPSGPSFRRLRKDVADGKAMCMRDYTADAASLGFEKEVFRYAEVLIIEHDWAAAFNGANVENAIVRLPFDVCAFEFKFSGRPVIAFAVQADTEIMFCPAVLCGDIWVFVDFAVRLGDIDPTDENVFGAFELLEALSNQIRAACIALDAEAAQYDTVREPYSSSGRGGSSQPLKPHHTVSLARRRARLPVVVHGETSGKRRRLHFRRGHWRHFEDHRTWIKWMLVGDPDLGFVEKEYRL